MRKLKRDLKAYLAEARRDERNQFLSAKIAVDMRIVALDGQFREKETSLRAYGEVVDCFYSFYSPSVVYVHLNGPIFVQAVLPDFSKA